MFHFDEAIKVLIEDVVEHSSCFNHINPGQVLISVKHSKYSDSEGIWAELLPMRYEEGSPAGFERNGSRVECYRMKPMFRDNQEILYILYFFLPRFLNLNFLDKLSTIFHELYHISPDFNGDLRRFPGKNYMHGSSTEQYNALMAALANDYLLRTANRERSDFLNFGYKALCKRYGSIFVKEASNEPLPVYVGSINR